MPKKFEDAVSAVLSGANPDVIADEILADVAAPAEKVEATPEPKKETIGSVVAELLMDIELSYTQIVNLVHAQFDNAATSSRSVASIAARLRRDGVEVPMRRKAKGDVA